VTEIESNNHVQVARYDDEHNYLQALTKSIVNGNTLIITNVEGVLDPELGNCLKTGPHKSPQWDLNFCFLKFRRKCFGKEDCADQ
jgi:hypothetical protein